MYKTGFRVLGIAESFKKGLEYSVLVGVVMRRDFIIDGIVIDRTRVGGMDSTDTVIEMYKKLSRDDIGLILLNGCIISWFNIVDLNRVYNAIHRPVACITYEESPGIIKYLQEYFPSDFKKRLDIYNKNGERRKFLLKTGFEIYYQEIGIYEKKLKYLLNKMTLNGATPEPLRVAKLIANAVLKAKNEDIEV